jgi:hypothetical protein
MEAKVLKVLLDRYPVDDIELSKRTSIDLREVRRTLIGMERRGWVKLDRLPDRMFVRLLRTDFLFLGRDETQRKAVKHKKGKNDKVTREKLLNDPYDDIMYA